MSEKETCSQIKSICIRFILEIRLMSYATKTWSGSTRTGDWELVYSFCAVYSKNHLFLFVFCFDSNIYLPYLMECYVIITYTENIVQ